MADMLDAWDSKIAALEHMADHLDEYQTDALRAAAQAVKPRLIEAAPARLDSKQTGGYKPPEGGEKTLKEAVRATVLRDKKTGRLQAVIDFGKWYTWIAHIVDIGHQAPGARAAEKKGTAAGQNTPAHPFVRAVQDGCQQLAQDTYSEAMDAALQKAMESRT